MNSYSSENRPKRPIDRLWDRLFVRWGHRFMGQYSGIDPEIVKADWERVLQWYLSDMKRAKAIAWALDNLPDDPIMAPAFKRLCQAMPEPAFRALPEPKPDPARVAAALSAMRRTQEAQDPLDWARRLRDRHAAGERLGNAQITAYRHALRHELAMTGGENE